MTPQEVLALMQILARQQLRIAQLEAEVAELQGATAAAVVKEDGRGVPV